MPGQAVDRALSILALFDEQTERLTIGEVADAVGVHRSTASRLLSTLERHRLVERDLASGSFGLGLGLVSLAGHVLNRFPVRAGGRQIVRALRDETGETAYLGVRDGDEVVYIEQASSPRVRVNADWVGRRQPLTAGVTGAVLLAFQAPEVIAELLREARADGQPVGKDLTEDELERARQQDHLERYHDAASQHAVIAAPVRDHRGDVIAAVCLSVPRHRVTPERFASELVPLTKRAAARVSEGLGYTGR